MKIAIIVHGRFHAFDLARALLQRGHRVTLLTNYPTWAVERFRLPLTHVLSFWPHGVLSRLDQWVHQKVRFPHTEAMLHRMFGRWAAQQVRKEPWDLVHCWSGVSEEVLRALEGTGMLTLLMRGSAHIRTQARLLEQEERRTGTPMNRPSPWMIAREEGEYALADRINVLSSFAYQTFVAEGVPPDKLRLLPLGAQTETFRPPPQILEARCQRILSGEPLRVVNIGTFSFRKGMWDMAAVIRGLNTQRFEFRFVGPIASEALALANTLRSAATFIPKRPQSELSAYYAWGDVFMLPTIEDGFQTVLSQAAASALPILTTGNGAGLDLVRDGETGWMLPIRSPEAFIKRLGWCDAHREELAAMVRRIYNEFRPRDWADVAANFEAFCASDLKTGKPVS